MTVRVVALDLMDTVVRDPFREALAAACESDLEELFARRDPELYPAFERGEIEEHDYWAAHRRAGLVIDPERFHAVRRAETRWLPGMAALLDELGDHALRVTASNYPTWVEELADEVLGDRFDRILASCHLGARKPDRAFYERLVVRLEMKPAEIAFVDDRERNVRAAREVGLHAHRFVDASSLRAWLVDLGLPLAPPGSAEPAPRSPAPSPCRAQEPRGPA